MDYKFQKEFDRGQGLQPKTLFAIRSLYRDTEE